MCRVIIAIVIVYGVIIIAPFGLADETRVVDQSIFPLDSTTFGHDSWQWDDWSKPAWNSNNNNIDHHIMGINKVTWYEVERTPGVYTLDNTPFDNNMKIAYECGQRVQLQFYPVSEWGCERFKVAPPHPRWRNFQSPPKQQYMTTNWRDVIAKIVERYDGDGEDDADWIIGELSVPFLYRIDIGAEVELDEKWKDQLGTIQNYFETLWNAKQAVQATNPNVLVGRAPMLTFDVFNDHPNAAEIESRLNDATNWPFVHRINLKGWIDASIQYQWCYDVMNIHPVGKYTSTLSIYEYLRKDGISGLGPSKLISAEDYITCPHNGFHHIHWNLCTNVYRDNTVTVERNVEDIYETLAIWWASGTPDLEDEALPPEVYSFWKDQSGHLVKRLVFGLTTGIQSMYLQPDTDQQPAYGGNPGWDMRLYAHGGLISKKVYNFLQNLPSSGKPSYYQFNWLLSKFIGVKGVEIVLENEGADFFPLTCVYKFEQADGEPLWVGWKDYTVVDSQPFTYSLSIPDAEAVKIYHTIAAPGQLVPDFELKDVTNGEVQLELTNWPIFIVKN